MQWLSPGRYVRHFEVGTGSGRYADFAIMLPDENGQTLYLPVGSSFPADEFAGDWNDDVRHRLSESVNAYARRIASELIKPGLTADFAIMLIQNELVCARVNGAGRFHARRTVGAARDARGAVGVLGDGARTGGRHERAGDAAPLGRAGTAAG